MENSRSRTTTAAMGLAGKAFIFAEGDIEEAIEMLERAAAFVDGETVRFGRTKEEALQKTTAT